MMWQSRSCGRTSSWIVGAVSGLAVVLSNSTGAASLLYPTSLQQFLDLDDVPKCVLCHTTEAGGAGTAVKPFARTLKDQGLEGGSNEATLKTAINRNIYDTDRDGVADVQELKEGSDPNVKDRTVEPPPPATGGTSGSGTGGAAGNPGSPSGGTSGEGPSPEPEAGSGSGNPPQNNEGGAGESNQEPEPDPSNPPPSLPPPPPPPPGGGQEIPLRETGCAFAAPPLDSALAPALLLGAACALAGRRRRRRNS